jgi:hypothetical protein
VVRSASSWRVATSFPPCSSAAGSSLWLPCQWMLDFFVRGSGCYQWVIRLVHDLLWRWCSEFPKLVKLVWDCFGVLLRWWSGFSGGSGVSVGSGGWCGLVVSSEWWWFSVFWFWPRYGGLGVVFCYWLFKDWLGLLGRGQWCVCALGGYVRVGCRVGREGVFVGFYSVLCKGRFGVL